jgi:hypothetical protein
MSVGGSEWNRGGKGPATRPIRPFHNGDTNSVLRQATSRTKGVCNDQWHDRRRHGRRRHRSRVTKGSDGRTLVWWVSCSWRATPVMSSGEHGRTCLLLCGDAFRAQIWVANTSARICQSIRIRPLCSNANGHIMFIYIDR